MKPTEDGWFFCLRDTAMTEREAVLRGEGWRITRTDLRQIPLGKEESDLCRFKVSPFGVCGFQIRRVPDEDAGKGRLE